MSDSVDTAMLFVYVEGGPIPDDEFTDWWIVEHAPLRLTVPGFNSAILYKATDARAPSWLACYDLESPAIATSDAYKALPGKGTEHEKALIPRLQDLNRSVLQHLITLTHPSSPPSSLPCPHVLIVSMQLGDAQDEAAFNAWYNDTHIHDVGTVPGFIRVRRFKVLTHVQLAGKPATDAPVHTYWAIYDVDRPDFDQSPEFGATIAAPAAKQVLGQLKAFTIRHFALHTNLPKSE